MLEFFNVFTPSFLKSNQSAQRTIQFSLFYTGQHHKLQISLKGLYNVYTYDALSQDLTSDEEKLPKMRKKTFTGKTFFF